MLSHPPPGSTPRGRSTPTASDDWPPIAKDDLPADILIPRLRGVTKTSQKQWSACCPAHPDSRPSLSITETEDYKLLICCHANCAAEKIMAAVGLKMSHLYASGYAIFSQQSGKRKNPALNRARPETSANPTVVNDDDVEALTTCASECFNRARDNNCQFLTLLAEQLRQPVEALLDFGVGLQFYKHRIKWTFPERDGKGRIIGLVRRDHDDEEKMCVLGSRRGLIFAPHPPSAALSNPAAPLYMPEGHTDTIALHTIGCLAIGRPAARLSNTTQAWLCEFLSANPNLWQNHPLVVVGDNDVAGKEGAEETAIKLSKVLNKAVIADCPPSEFKDMREWITAGSFVPGWPILNTPEVFNDK